MVNRNFSGPVTPVTDGDGGKRYKWLQNFFFGFLASHSYRRRRRSPVPPQPPKRD